MSNPLPMSWDPNNPIEKNIFFKLKSILNQPNVEV
jgi:hypothetical protein